MKSERAQKEEKILQFWKENKIFSKTLSQSKGRKEFVFYEGPPTANAAPALHHLVSRVFKDALPRYKTMQGFHVPRKAGWDTHGLPVELQIEKKLGLKSKKEIETYGVERFNKEAKQSVFEYIGEWEKFTERIGYWVDFKNAYYTFNNSYIETLWGILAHTEKRKLLYKDYKVLPWCPRCGTALSSHELAQGYQDVKDISLYVKFKIKDFPNAYFLAWTTTPWTLPGNVALAVGEKVDYVEAKVGEEILVLAKDKLSVITEPYEILAEHKGKEMANMSYEPLYPFLEGKSDKSFKVYTADFVNTEDGTGIVHTAVMYGQDDFVLGNKVGLPKHHLVDETGHFKSETGFLAGESVVEESTAVEILKDLQNRKLLFDKESYTHSYPFCWRCKTRLIYYARDSWYIEMSKLRDELVKENKKINWVPEYIREGRFGDWLNEVKDWAISRERYWGTPLPVWENALKSKRIVVDSLETLKKYSNKSGNKYLTMRHGESDNIVKGIGDMTGDTNNHLTEKGKEEVRSRAKKLKKIDIILSSPFPRTHETAQIVHKELGLPDEALVIDARLHEVGESEDALTLRRRMGEFIFDIEKKYQGKNILIVSHGMPMWVLHKTAVGERSDNFTEGEQHRLAEVKQLSFFTFPHNENYELDLHRPYIDEVTLEIEGEEYRRVKEVMDVWFDSGAMPFAQDPLDFARGKPKYPADFISEAIDQTRGWFYTLHAIGVLMGKGYAYKNVICLGHILDKEGKKMSKSVGNVVNPWEMIDKYGVDTLRLWMYSVNQPGESKNFDERSVDELQKRVFNLLDNVYSFYELYRDKELEGESPGSQNVLDIWILSHLSGYIEAITEDLNKYKILEPVRMLREFIDDLSTWYLRRSRERIKDGDKEAKQTLHFVLKELSKLLAPFAPFAAEDLYQKLRNEKDEISVHLTKWPDFDFGGPEPISYMRRVRELASLGLEARSRANIKVRQPLAELKIKNKDLGKEYLEIIKDELNVKAVTVDENLTEEVWFDTHITPELEEEGRVRDAIRAVQEWRKEKGLKPGEKSKYETDDEFFFQHKEEIEKVTNVELSHIYN